MSKERNLKIYYFRGAINFENGKQIIKYDMS